MYYILLWLITWEYGMSFASTQVYSKEVLHHPGWITCGIWTRETRTGENQVNTESIWKQHNAMKDMDN